jgi:monofunctional biosynthetic peptidoglycan transglycosylase
MEEHLSKQRIFEIYLNVIEWSNGVYGIGPAAREYFGKDPSELRPEEAAVLAAMIPSPRSYSASMGLTSYLEKRKTELLRRMVKYKHLSPEEFEEAQERKIEFQRD